MSGIFISYRREDSAATAHRLHQALTARFGADSVFIDVENSRNIKVIPVLVDGATLPAQRDLPPPLATLVQAQALDIRPDRFDQGIERLGRALEMVRKGTTTAGLWFAMITRRHKALDPLDLHKPEVLWHALRFMLYMVLIEALLRLPTVAVASPAYSSKLWYLLDYAAASYVQYLGAGFILHFAMKLFGGTAQLQRSIAAFCFLSDPCGRSIA